MNEQHDPTGSNDGAPWWKRTLTRREAGVRLAQVAAGVLILPSLGALAGCGDDEESIETVEGDALEMQRADGWNVGAEDRALRMSDTSATDSKGGADWKSHGAPNRLLADWKPADARWQPFVVPTLVQSMAQASLGKVVTPVSSAKLDEAYRRGLGMREILLKTKNPETVAIVADLPGPESVAFAAALADVADPVITFDNWPHPEGVVPAQQTLGSLLFYAREVAEKSAARQKAAAASGSKLPAVFILDSDRLDAPASDAQFDNRYLAKLPDAPTLKASGVTNVLYAVADTTQKTELDDLNEPFADYREGGLDVSLLPLTDFKPAAMAAGATDTQRATRGASGHYGGGYHTPYHYGGGLMFLPLFFHNYSGYGYRGGTLPPYSRYASAPVSRRTYVPTRRPTVFSSRTTGATAGVGRTKPTGFGRVSRPVTTGSGGRSSFGGSRSSGSYGRARGGGSM